MKSLSEILQSYPLPADLRAQLSAELAGMERDAGRYRWLSQGMWIDGCPGYQRVQTSMCVDNLNGHHLAGVRLDTAIDAARTKGK